MGLNVIVQNASQCTRRLILGNSVSRSLSLGNEIFLTGAGRQQSLSSFKMELDNFIKGL